MAIEAPAGPRGLGLDQSAAICRQATPGDATVSRAIRFAAAADLSARFGPGHWSQVMPLGDIEEKIGAGLLYLIEADGSPVATFALGDLRIDFYQPAWFADPSADAGYLTDFAVLPTRQRQGIGRFALVEIEALCRSRRLSALRFDAYQGPAGAGPFYVKCGYIRRHSNEVRGVGRDYYEKVLTL